MNRSILRLEIILVVGVLLTGGCQSESQVILPVTGSNSESSVPAQVSLAQQNALEYLLASRLASVPPLTDWELQKMPDEKKYYFYSGDWRMVIWATDSEDQDQHIAIVNRVKGLSWTGYVIPDGRVVDTAYGR